MMRTLIGTTIALLVAATAIAPTQFDPWLDRTHDAPVTLGAPAVQEAGRGGSEIEDATGIHYYHDAGIEGDAPNACEDLDPSRILRADDEETMNALVVPVDDETDVFAVPLGAEHVGEIMDYSIDLGVVTTLYTITFDIVDSTCQHSVFDFDSDLYHPERWGPAERFETKAGHEEKEFTVSGDHECHPDEWKFNLKHLRGAQPDELYVEWTNGDRTYVPAQDDPSQVSKYVTSYNTEHTIERIIAYMPVGWTGELTVAHGPCGVVAGDEFVAPVKQPDGGTFQVTRADQYVLIVNIESTILDDLPVKTSMTPSTTRVCDPSFACEFAFLEMDYHSLLQKRNE